MASVLIYAGAGLWVAAMAVLAQRQRVLARRLTRLERAAGLRRRPPAGASFTVSTVNRVGRSPESVRAVPAPRRSPTVQQLARLATPLQRAGG